MTPLTELLADAVADTSAPLADADRADLAELLPLVERHADAAGYALDADRRLALAVHALAFVRRVRDGEHLEPLGDEVYAEVPAEQLAAVRRLVDTYCTPRGHAAPDTEVLLFALHFEVARQQADPRSREHRA